VDRDGIVVRTCWARTAHFIFCTRTRCAHAARSAAALYKQYAVAAHIARLRCAADATRAAARRAWQTFVLLAFVAPVAFGSLRGVRMAAYRNTACALTLSLSANIVFAAWFRAV